MKSKTPTRYRRELKESIARRYLSSDISYRELAEETGADKSSVRSWVQAFKEHGSVGTKRSKTTATTDGRPAAEKLRLVIASKGLADSERGEFLRREGVHDDDLERWEREALGGLESKPSSEAQHLRIRHLERSGAKQAKRLKEAEALLDLQKKVHALWGDADDDTGGTND